MNSPTITIRVPPLFLSTLDKRIKEMNKEAKRSKLPRMTRSLFYNLAASAVIDGGTALEAFEAKKKARQEF